MNDQVDVLFKELEVEFREMADKIQEARLKRKPFPYATELLNTYEDARRLFGSKK